MVQQFHLPVIFIKSTFVKDVDSAEIFITLFKFSFSGHILILFNSLEVDAEKVPLIVCVLSNSTLYTLELKDASGVIVKLL